MTHADPSNPMRSDAPGSPPMPAGKTAGTSDEKGTGGAPSAQTSGEAGPTGEKGLQSAELLDSYWHDLRDGEITGPNRWLQSHGALADDVLGQMQVLDLLNEALQDDEASSRLVGLANEVHPPQGSGDVLPPGTLLGGKLRVLSLLDASAMGEVYVAWHTLLEREVAVRVLPAHLAKDEQAALFCREARARSRLEGHEHILATMDGGTDNDRHYLVMDYVSGVDLATYVKRHGPMEWQEATECIRQAALALDHAHRHGMVHGHIKPTHVIRGDDGKIRILDWGQSRLASIAAKSPPTQPQWACPFDNCDYLAPEQTLDPAATAPESDLYSLGALLYFLLTGLAPFSGHSTRQGKLQAHRQEPPPSVTLRRPAIPLALDTIVGRLLEKRRDHRPSAGKLVDLLERTLAGKPIGAKPSNRIAWTLGSLAIMLAGFLAFKSWFGSGAQNSAPRIGGHGPMVMELELAFYRVAAGPGATILRIPAILQGQVQFIEQVIRLSPNDRLGVRARLNEPANWHILRRTAGGNVQVVAFGSGKKEIQLSPSASTAEADFADPPGVQLMLLTVGEAVAAGDSRTSDDRKLDDRKLDDRKLTEALEAMQPPPEVELQAWMNLGQDKQGNAQWRGTGSEEAVDPARGYLRLVESRLPPGFRAVAAVFLPCIR